MDDKGRRGWRRLLASFVFAGRGFTHVVKKEQNMQIHLLLSCIVILAAFFLDVNEAHYPVLILLIGGMIALETMNTAIERTVDLVTSEYHPIAKLAKDIAAAAVLIYSITALIVGYIIFYEPILQWFSSR
ncbi:diacylglycerol kinase [Salsuginibacillus kocurii]|uniref:diacylglycerol kinase n=1 Tax=Salsuginibacillus kocurii TaxID=427078 RepID=UPI0003824901